MNSTCEICGKAISPRGRASHLKAHAARGESAERMAELRRAERLVRQEREQSAARRAHRRVVRSKREARIRRGARSGQG